MAGQGGELARRGRWSEVFERLLMLPGTGGGVKADVAHSVLAFRGCMPEHAGDELGGLEGEVLAFGVTVVEVGEGHGVVGEVQAAVRAERAALDVAGQVQRDTAAVGVGFVDLDVPVAPPLLLDGRLPVSEVLAWRQMKSVVRQRQLQRCEQPAAKQLAQGFERQQEMGSASAPQSGAVEPAGADQAMHVRVVAEVAPPGVKRHEQPRHGTQVTGVGAQIEQTRSCAIEQHLSHNRAVVLPQPDEHVRQCEDHMEVRAGQQSAQLRCQPLLARRVGAARATAVPAGVVLGRIDVALRTDQHMKPQFGLETLADAVGRTLFSRMQRTALGVIAKVLSKHILQTRSHSATPSPAHQRSLPR